MGGQYNAGLVYLSVVIAVLASYTALDLNTSVAVSKGRARKAWIAAGSLAMGTGIWSMHFIGMLAFRLPGVPVAYSLGPVILSILVAVLASAVALATIAQGKIPTGRFLVAGFAMGAAIAGMHYTGMSGLRSTARVEWNPLLVVASVIIAVAASFVALRLAAGVRDADRSRARMLKLRGAAILGLAITGMHYTAMAAARFIPYRAEISISNEFLVATPALAVSVVGSSMLILLMAIAGSLLAREMVERAHLSDRIRASEEYFRSLIETATDLIVVIDKNGRRTFVSPSYERTLGYKPEDLLGGIAFEFVHEEDLPAVRTAFAQLIQSPDAYQTLDARLRAADGSWHHVRATAHNLLGNPAVAGVVVTARDETDRRQLEISLRQAQKMEAVGQLAGGVAHDFNNLLTVILGHLELLLQDAQSSDGLKSDLLEVRSAAQRAAALTRQLLAFSRRQMLLPRVVDLNQIVSGMRNTFARVLGDGIAVETRLDENLWPVHADAGQIEEVLLILTVNARDAMPNGGTVSIETRNCTAPQDVVQSHDPVPDGDYVRIVVRDEGYGIADNALSHLFEPFFTTKGIGKGTGLGLSTVYGIVKQSGGYISVTSKVGNGTTFSLYFPRVSATR